MAELNNDDLILALGKDPEEVIEYFKSLGVVLSDDWEDYLKNIGTDAFKIAGINSANHLMDAKDIIEEAIAKGTDRKEFINQLIENLKLKAWHAKLVVTQNISNSYNAGRFIQQQDGTERFPYLRPIVMLDQKTTDICTWLSSAKICIRVDDPDLKNMYSPRHFRCRTIWVAISEKQKDRLGLTVKKIKDIPEKNWNQKEFRRLPNAAYKPDLSKFPNKLADKLRG